MSAVLHMPAFNPAPHGPAFTSVNGRPSLSPTEEQKPHIPATTSSATWSPSSQGPGNSYHSPNSDTTASTVTSGDRSPASDSKRRRSVSAEDVYMRRSPDVASITSKQLPPPHSSSMDAPRPSLPPMVRPDERRWQTEPREILHGQQDFQHRDARPTEPVHNGMSSATHTHASPEHEDPNATELTRAGVQVELKKRKRQFANRTKTGCGTCRRRKKKCDEAKPECNNCTRGGFICEGYANKIPWPKGRPSKFEQPLQAKERPSVKIPNAYGELYMARAEAPRSTEYAYPPDHRLSSAHERKSSIPTTWNPPPPPPPPSRPLYQPEVQAPPPPAQYTQPSTNYHDRPRSHDRQVVPQHQSQPPHPHQHDHRSYHHTPQSTGHTGSSTPSPAPSMTTQPAHQQHHVPHQHTRPPPPPPSSCSGVPSTTAPQGPSPTHYAPPPPLTFKSEKAKMLAGLPFVPFDRVLLNERRQCAGAVFLFNNTANASNVIGEDTRRGQFKSIVAARWISVHDERPNLPGHFGENSQVATPFHCDYGYHLSIGEDVVIDSDCHFRDSARIAIGRNTKIGARVTIQTLKTPTDKSSLKGVKSTEVAQEVYIGENVYIGDSCVIEAGVRIGNNTIVRPGSVVSRTLPDNCVAHGNPAVILPS